jgi:hypothetical protein
MTHPYLDDVRILFELSEGETNLSRKFVALEEALDLVDLVLEESNLPQSDRELAASLRNSNVRRLFSQLDSMRSIQFDDWVKYIDLLRTRCRREFETAFEEDSPLKDGFQAFVAIWWDKVLEEIEPFEKQGLEHASQEGRAAPAPFAPITSTSDQSFPA